MKRTRVSQGETTAQVWARLTARQQQAAGRVKDAEAERIRLVWLLAGQQAEVYRLVSAALDQGVPAMLLAEQLGVTVSRVYQVARMMPRHRHNGEREEPSIGKE